MIENNILVLGSSGLIGRELVKNLKNKGMNVTEYDIQRTLTEDLTNPAWNRFLQDAIWKSNFVYFLAFDVGGAKYLKNNQASFRFIHNNTMMMSNVFDILKLTKAPHIFTSSMMVGHAWSEYGNLKKLGEHYVKSIGTGKSVRLWNVYGYEEDGEKSHVIPDFCRQALQNNEIRMMTNGQEERQFIHAKDAAEALETIRLGGMGKDTTNCFDVSSGIWTSISELADMCLQECCKQPYKKTYSLDGADTVQKGWTITPVLGDMEDLQWKPKIDLKTGIRMVAEEIRNKG